MSSNANQFGNRMTPRQIDHELSWEIKQLLETRREGSHADHGFTIRVLIRKHRVPWDHPKLQELFRFLFEATSLDTRHDRIAEILIAHPHTPGELLDRLFEQFRQRLSATWICALMIHPHATPELVRKIYFQDNSLLESTSAYIARIVDSSNVRNHPEIRPHLLNYVKFHAPGLLYMFLLDAYPSECPTLFRMVAPEDAARALNINGEEIVPLLDADDLVPLLSSSNRFVRETAISFIGLLNPPGSRGPIEDRVGSPNTAEAEDVTTSFFK